MTISSSLDLPFYQTIGEELALFETCYQQQLPLMLKGPTGCGKSRFVAYMAAKLGRPLITVACHDDTSATDLLGRHLIKGNETIWVDGPVTRAVRENAILYLDEMVEARADILVVIHPLTDHRRELHVDRLNEVVKAGAQFMLVTSYNPHYQHGLKSLKPSTRQRFVSLSFEYPNAVLEQQIIQGETSTQASTAKKLVNLAQHLRQMQGVDLAEVPSTRLLVDAAKLMAAGLPSRYACRCAIVEPLTDDPTLAQAMMDLVNISF